MKIEIIPISQIKPYWRNPRKNDLAIEPLKKSISEYGFNQPIVIDKKNVIIVGHSRYRALVELGYENAYCVVSDLSPTKAKEYRIADNKTAEFASWDMDALIPELREIPEINEMQLFFDKTSIDALLNNSSIDFEVTNEEVKKIQEESDNHFQNHSESIQGSYLNVLCPHCGEEFFVDKSEFGNTKLP